MHLTFGFATPVMYKFTPQLIFTTTDADLDRYKPVLDWVKDNWTDKSRLPRVGFMGIDLTSTRQADQPGLFKYAEAKGVELLPFTYFPLVATDFTTELTRVYNTQKADYVIVRGAANHLVAILKNADRMGIKDKMKWIGSCYAHTPVAIGLSSKEFMAGIYHISHAALPSETHLPGIKEALKIIKKYRKMELDATYIHGIVLSKVAHESIRRTLEKVGLKKLGGRAMAEQLCTFKDFDMGGLVPPITMVKGKIGISPYLRIVQWQKDGSIKPISGWARIEWTLGRK